MARPATGSGEFKPPEPFTLVIFGATGDLTHRKLIPAVFCLFCEGFLPKRFRIVAYARRDKTEDEYRDELLASVKKHCRMQPVDEAAWKRFARRIAYHKAQMDREGFESLRDLLCGEDKGCSGPGNCLFYSATPPKLFPEVARHLKAVGLSEAGRDAGRWARIIIEKPFGRDLESARELNDILRDAFEERQIFRIDHYLGKETVQNIMVLRFANSIFEPVWNQKYVDHVQITVAESSGVQTRGRYFDTAGILRDMVQNHMMHLLCLVAMESPGRLAADSVRDEKVKLLRALRPVSGDCAAGCLVRGQYTGNSVGGEEAPGYREEDGVAEDSQTETFAALKAHIDNWRWAGVPFYLRTGKRMPVRVTEISIHFKEVPRILFNDPPIGPLPPNVLAMRIQPREGISMRFQLKRPGLGMHIEPFHMDFGYAREFGRRPPEAYERLLLDAAVGDATLFTRSDEIETAWAYLSPILEGCSGPEAPLASYPAGSWGPEEADELIEADGREWTIFRRKE